MLSASIIESKKIQTTIVENSIADDQQLVIQQWYKTFKHNPADDVATNMAKLMLACVAAGDFQTRSILHDNPELAHPSHALTATDYISHASRIILDYRQLSGKNLAEFIEYFPKTHPTVVSRSATHAVVRDGEKVKELKGFMLGACGQLPTVIRTAYDFGVNIAMGGLDQLNFVGHKITNNGFSGHMYFHHYDAEQLLMLGLEQSAPSASIFEVIWGAQKDDDNAQFDHDQFGQGHSLTGASDTFTAAGSLYFSDPVYQAKLLAERHTAPPDKYGAMQVTLTDQNWEDVRAYLAELNHNLVSDQHAAMQQLARPPSCAVDRPAKVKSYLSLNIKAYFKRIKQLLENCDAQIVAAWQPQLDALQADVIAFQAGNVALYEKILTQIVEITAAEKLPANYLAALDRIKVLFQHQRMIDPNLEVIHKDLIIKRTSEELLDQIAKLQDNLKIIKAFFKLIPMQHNQAIQDFLARIAAQDEQLAQFKAKLLREDPARSYVDDTESSLSESLLQRSWIEVQPLGLSDLQEVKQGLVSTEELIAQTPEIILREDEQAVMAKERELRAALLQAQGRLDELTGVLQQQEVKLQQAAALRDALSQAEAVIAEVRKSLSQQKAQLEAQTRAAEEKLAQATKTHATQLEDLTSQVEALRAEKERLHDEFASKYQAMAQNKGAIATDLEQQLERTEQEFLRQQKFHETALKKLTGDHRQAIDVLKIDIAEKEAEIAALRAELTSEVKEYQALSTQWHDAQHDFDELQVESSETVQALRRELDALQQRAEALAVDLDDAGQRLVDANNVHQHVLAQQQDAHAADAAALRETIADLRQQVRDLTQELADKAVADHDELQATKQQCTALQEENAQLHAILAAFANQVFTNDPVYQAMLKDAPGVVLTQDKEAALQVFLFRHPYIQRIKTELFGKFDKELYYLQRHPEDDVSGKKTQGLQAAKDHICHLISQNFLASADFNAPDIKKMHLDIMNYLNDLSTQTNEFAEESNRVEAFIRDCFGIVLGIGISFGLIFFSANYRSCWFSTHTQSAVDFASRYFDHHARSDNLITVK